MILPNTELAARRHYLIDSSRAFSELVLDESFPELDTGSRLVLDGLLSYAYRRGFDEEGLRSPDALDIIAGAAENIVSLVEGTSVYQPRKFSFVHKPLNLASLFEQAANSASNAASFVGTTDIFRRRPERGERLTRFVTNLDDQTYLSLKGSTGAGAFALDFSIGHIVEKDWARNRGEIWRVGFDILGEGSNKTLRILRSGSVMTAKKKGSEEKQKVARKFRKEHGISVSRALALTTLFVAHFDPDIKEIVAPSLLNVRDPLLGIRKSRCAINFDYDSFWMGFGFSEPDKDGWMHLASTGESFYNAVLDIEHTGTGMNGGELSGVLEMLAAVDGLTSTRTEALHQIRTHANDLPNEDMHESVLAHKKMLGRA